MNTEEKIKELLDFSKKLKNDQRIVFSCEGNLNNKQGIHNSQQKDRSNKPIGLWYSLGSDWIDYLSEVDLNEYTWERARLSWYTHIYEITLGKNILTLQESELKPFLAEHKIDKHSIDWKKVAKKWQGIEIEFNKGKHYLYEFWSCSSGCIWNKNAITNIKLLKKWKINWLSNDKSEDLQQFDNAEQAASSLCAS